MFKNLVVSKIILIFAISKLIINNDMKIKGILRQIWCGITNRKYPSGYVWGYWEYRIDNKGNVKYQHWKTLSNFIKNKKTN